MSIGTYLGKPRDSFNNDWNVPYSVHVYCNFGFISIVKIARSN